MICKENCGECCGIIPFPKDLAKETEHLAQVQPIKVMESEGELFIITEDLFCVYLDRKTKKCVIYEKRPRICRLYGNIPTCPCPYFKLNGERRSLTERKLIQAQIDASVHMAMQQWTK